MAAVSLARPEKHLSSPRPWDSLSRVAVTEFTSAPGDDRWLSADIGVNDVVETFKGLLEKTRAPEPNRILVYTHWFCLTFRVATSLPMSYHIGTISAAICVSISKW